MGRNATRVKDLTGMEQLIIDIKPRRCDSFVYQQKEFDVSKLVEYIDKRKAKGDKVTYFHAFVTALAKTIYNREKLNRFIQNRHVYRHNDVVISFVAKVSFEDYSEEMMILVPIAPDDNINTISEKISKRVNKVRDKDGYKKEGANKALDILGKLPNIIRVPIVGMFKWLDDKGCLPFGLDKDNLYFSSMIVSNLGSIKNDSIHHNITNFGTCSSLTTMGMIKNEEVIHDNGKREIIKVCDWGIAFDERVGDGFYFIKSMEIIQYLFDHPEMLEEAANTKINLDNK